MYKLFQNRVFIGLSLLLLVAIACSSSSTSSTPIPPKEIKGSQILSEENISNISKIHEIEGAFPISFDELGTTMFFKSKDGVSSINLNTNVTENITKGFQHHISFIKYIEPNVLFTLSCQNSSSCNDEIRLWDIQKKEPITDLQSDSETISFPVYLSEGPMIDEDFQSMALSNNGNVFAVGGLNELSVYSFRYKYALAGHISFEIPLSRDSYETDRSVVAFSDDDALFAFNSFDGIVGIYNIIDIEAPIKLIKTKSKEISRLIFSKDSQLLVTASEGYGDEFAQIWDINTGNLKIQVSDTTGITDVAINPDNNLLVTANEGNVIKIWDAKTGFLLHTLNFANDGQNDWGYTSYVDFSPDGKLLIVDTYNTGIVFLGIK